MRTRGREQGEDEEGDKEHIIIIIFSPSPLLSSSPATVSGCAGATGARATRLCGADLHLINSSAFLGGVADGTNTFVSSFSSSSSSFSDDVTVGSGLAASGDSSLMELRARLYLSRSGSSLTRRHSGRHRKQRKAPSKQRQRGRRHLRGLGLAASLFVFFRRMRTWPMHVTFGDDGSPSSVSDEVLLRETNMGLERTMEALFPLVLLFPLLPFSKPVSAGACVIAGVSLSGRPGLAVVLGGAEGLIRMIA